jgi:hypothetical protein
MYSRYTTRVTRFLKYGGYTLRSEIEAPLRNSYNSRSFTGNLLYDHSQKGGFQITLIVHMYYFVIRLICVIVSHNKILVVYRNSER